MAAPHGTKRHRENDDSNEGRRPTKVSIGGTENYPVSWGDISQLPRLCWSLRDPDRRRSSIPPPAVRNITISRVSHSVVPFPPPSIRYLPPALHTNSRSAPPRRARPQDEPYYPLTRPLRPATHSLIHSHHLLDHRIHLPTTTHPSPKQSLPTDLTKLLHSLETPIATLTTSSFPPEYFQDFILKHNHPPAADDRLLPDGVLDTIAGHSPAFPTNNIYVAFNAMKPVNDISDIVPVPYAFDGVRPADLEHKIRDQHEEILVTTKRYELPVAPNFFFESRRRQQEGAAASQRAAAVDGAYGARGMYVLKNYGRKRGAAAAAGVGDGDGEGLAFSATYDDEVSSAGSGRMIKVLRLFAHHVAASGDESGEGGGDDDVEGLTYHMTELGSWEMTGEYGEFLTGARAFRNLRLWAAMVRIGGVEEGNYRVGLEKR